MWKDVACQFDFLLLFFQKHDQGQVLLEMVFRHLDLTERDYFGLQLADDCTDNPVSVSCCFSLPLQFFSLHNKSFLIYNVHCLSFLKFLIWMITGNSFAFELQFLDILICWVIKVFLIISQSIDRVPVSFSTCLRQLRSKSWRENWA